MKPHYLLIFFIIALPKTSFGNDVEYALKIKNSHPEYGTSIPKELCQNEKRSPCRLPVFKLYNVVSDITGTKANLNPTAYAALSLYSEGAQVVWEYNLCKPHWDKKKPCAEVLGYLVVKDYEVIFYVFQKN